jgi:hypothetical protein
MSYWFEGNNFSFVQLLSQIPYATACKEIVDASNQTNEAESDDDDTKKAHTYLKAAMDFFQSFAHEAADVWEIVSSPFQQVSKDEINEFIADDDDEVVGDSAMYHTFNRESAIVEQADNERAAAYYEARVYDDSEGISEEEYGEIDNTDLIFEDDSTDDDEEEYQSSSADERPRPTSAQRKRQNESMTGVVAAAKRRISPSKYRRIAHSFQTGSEEKKLQDEAFDNANAQLHDKPMSSTRKRLVINESDDE